MGKYSVFIPIVGAVLFFKAFEFRKFWGKKSEVRRFQDGSISEAVVWCNTSVTLAQKRMICHQIVSYLLNEKFDIPIENGVTYVADQLDSLLKRHMVRLHNICSYQKGGIRTCNDRQRSNTFVFFSHCPLSLPFVFIFVFSSPTVFFISSALYSASSCAYPLCIPS